MIRTLSQMASVVRFGALVIIVSLVTSAFPAALFVAEAAANVAVFADSFEDTPAFTHWDSPVDPIWQNSSSVSRTGSRGAHAAGNSQGADLLKKTVSTEGFENVSISFWYKSDGLDAGDVAAVEWYDGTAWQQAWMLPGVDGTTDDVAAWTQVMLDLPDAASENEHFAFRFSATFDAGNDKFSLDDVNVAGDDVVVLPPPCSLVLSSDTSDYVVERNVLAKALSFVHAAWLAALPASTADWIWGDDPVVDPTVVEVQTFIKKFNWTGGVPASATLKVLSDNGHVVTLGSFTEGSTAENSYAVPAVYDVSAAVVAGLNTLEIKVTNTGVPNASAGNNPAGLMYELIVNGVGEDCGDIIPTNPTVLPEDANLEITRPVLDRDVVVGMYDFTANYSDDDEVVDEINWAIRAGTCEANTGTIAGNVDGFSNSSTFIDGVFTAVLNTTMWEPGSYCFVVNPLEGDEEDLRATRLFTIPKPPTSTVTLCKLDTQENTLTGWQLMLRGEKIETVTVPANAVAGADTVNTLQTDTPYIAVASGVWMNTGQANNSVDAEYSTQDNWVTNTDGFPTYQTDILELQINKTFDPQSVWGAYNGTHTYAQAFTMSVDDKANFRIFDGQGTIPEAGWYGDNSGSLTIDVYVGYVGTTGENGCVTFKDVSYGTYVADEVMQIGWEAVTGPQEVTVNSRSEQVWVVNRDLSYIPPCELTIVSDTGTVIEDNNLYAVAAYNNHPSWTASIPGATWIWETEYVVDPEMETTRTFVETFTVDNPTAAEIDIAADNGYMLYVNGSLVADRAIATYPTNYQSHTQKNFDILPYLQSGSNTMKVVVTNEGMNDARAITNPAGVLYKIAVNGSGNCDRTTEVEDIIEVPQFMVSGYKWHDIDGDGFWDKGEGDNEPALSGWEIHITDGEEILIDTTDENGAYSFMVPWGEWTVSEIAKQGWSQTGTLQNGSPLESDVCQFVFGEMRAKYKTASMNTCDFGNQAIVLPPVTNNDDNDEDSRSTGTRVGVRAPRGQVLGASTDVEQCSLYLTDYMRMSMTNNPEQVMKLQIFLNAVGIQLPVTKVFDAATDAAVRKFQASYFGDVLTPWGLGGSTGYVYKTTRWKINNIVCPGSEVYPTPLI